MSQPPTTRDFSAWINLVPGAPSKLIVVGEVETPASNQKPHLSVSAGSPPARTLHLDLSIRNTGGIGTPAFQFWPARHEQSAAKGEYASVVIFWNGEEHIRLPVTEAH